MSESFVCPQDIKNKSSPNVVACFIGRLFKLLTTGVCAQTLIFS
jgi:hypothetical protein